MKRIILAVIVAILAAGSAQADGEWKCTAIQAFVCTSAGLWTDSAECNTVPNRPTSYLLFDIGKSTFSRCDSKGCDFYKAEIIRSGGFTTITIEGKGGALMKFKNDGSEYVEVVTTMLDIIIYRGTCTQ
jgi:hypothetical protein